MDAGLSLQGRSRAAPGEAEADMGSAAAQLPFPAARNASSLPSNHLIPGMLRDKHLAFQMPTQGVLLWVLELGRGPLGRP